MCSQLSTLTCFNETFQFLIFSSHRHYYDRCWRFVQQLLLRRLLYCAHIQLFMIVGRRNIEDTGIVTLLTAIELFTIRPAFFRGVLNHLASLPLYRSLASPLLISTYSVYSAFACLQFCKWQRFQIFLKTRFSLAIVF